MLCIDGQNSEGEIQAMGQILGHKRLPVCVGNIEDKAIYRPER